MVLSLYFATSTGSWFTTKSMADLVTADIEMESTGCDVPTASARNSEGVLQTPYLYVVLILLGDSVSDPCVGGVTSNLRYGASVGLSIGV